MGLRIHDVGLLRFLRGTTEVRWPSCSACSLMRCRPQPSRPASPASMSASSSGALRSRTPTQSTDGRRGVAVPRVSRSETAADPTPLFVLRNVSLTGAHAIAPERTRRRLAALCRQEGLAGRSRDDRHRHRRRLPRRRLSPQPRHRAAAGHRGRCGPHPGHRRQHHRRRAEGRGRRAVRHPRAAVAGRRRAAVAPDDAGAPAHADQHAAGRAHRRHPARGDRNGERTFPSHRLGADLARLCLCRPRQSRLVRGRAVAELRDRGLQLDDRTGRHARAQSRHHAGRSAPASLRTAVLRHADRRRRAAGRRLRPLQRSVARRLAAAVCRQHQDRSVRSCAPALCR